MYGTEILLHVHNCQEDRRIGKAGQWRECPCHHDLTNEDNVAAQIQLTERWKEVTAPSPDGVPPPGRFPSEKKDRGLDIDDWYNGDNNNQQNNLKARTLCNFSVDQGAGGWVDGAPNGSANFYSGLNKNLPCNGCVCGRAAAVSAANWLGSRGSGIVKTLGGSNTAGSGWKLGRVAMWRLPSAGTGMVVGTTTTVALDVALTCGTQGGTGLQQPRRKHMRPSRKVGSAGVGESG